MATLQFCNGFRNFLPSTKDKFWKSTFQKLEENLREFRRIVF